MADETIFDRLETRLQQASDKLNQADDCYNGDSSRGVCFIAFDGQAIGGFTADKQINLPFPCDTFFIVSMKQITNSAYLSLTPTGIPSGSAIAGYTVGHEQWFPLNVPGSQLGGPGYWSVVKLKNKVSRIYISSGTESGQATNMTLCCSADGAAQVSGGPWT